MTSEIFFPTEDELRSTLSDVADALELVDDAAYIAFGERVTLPAFQQNRAHYVHLLRLRARSGASVMMLCINDGSLFEYSAPVLSVRRENVDSVLRCEVAVGSFMLESYVEHVELLLRIQHESQRAGLSMLKSSSNDEEGE